MISDRHRFIFIHINKTGGTSIEKVFEPEADQENVAFKHRTAAFYRQTFPEQFRDYFKFAFVRNPWDWLVSRYHWSRDRQHLFDYSFQEFLWRLKNGIPLSPGAPWLEGEALQPQLARVSIDGQIAVDFVGRFETIQSDFDSICSRLQIEARTLPHVFQTDRASYVDYYDDETRRVVKQLYAADIIAFGYRFRDGLPPRFSGTSEMSSHRRDPFVGTARGIRVERLEGNPIIRAAMLSGNDGGNINGPSLIRVPAWIEKPLGRYYLYFAHHEGKYIRLAYADHLQGPWTIYEPGALRLENTACDVIDNVAAARNKHVASPDVHVDNEARRIRMYFHGPVHEAGPRQDDGSYQQLSMVAISKDGLEFDARDERLGKSYFRAFKWEGAWFALAMPGVFYRSDDGLTRFVEGPTLFTSDMRHSALALDGATLQVFYSIVGDNPERIVVSNIDLARPWMEWTASEPRVVVEPQTDWEGAGLHARPSARGIARGPVRELRDPAIFTDEGRTYLLYSVAGESGIAIAELHQP